jgi:hypothetical protein
MKRRIGWKKDQRHFSLLHLLDIDIDIDNLFPKIQYIFCNVMLEQRNCLYCLYLLLHLRTGNAGIYRFFHRIPFRRICLSGKKFMPTVVNPQHWKRSLLRFLCRHARIASGEIILLTDNELLAFTWGSRKVKTERP